MVLYFIYRHVMKVRGQGSAQCVPGKHGQVHRSGPGFDPGHGFVSSPIWEHSAFTFQLLTEICDEQRKELRQLLKFTTEVLLSRKESLKSGYRNDDFMKCGCVTSLEALIRLWDSSSFLKIEEEKCTDSAYSSVNNKIVRVSKTAAAVYFPVTCLRLALKLHAAAACAN